MAISKHLRLFPTAPQLSFHFFSTQAPPATTSACIIPSLLRKSFLWRQANSRYTVAATLRFCFFVRTSILRFQFHLSKSSSYLIPGHTHNSTYVTVCAEVFLSISPSNPHSLPPIQRIHETKPNSISPLSPLPLHLAHQTSPPRTQYPPLKPTTVPFIYDFFAVLDRKANHTSPDQCHHHSRQDVERYLPRRPHDRLADLVQCLHRQVLEEHPRCRCKSDQSIDPSHYQSLAHSPNAETHADQPISILPSGTSSAKP